MQFMLFSDSEFDSYCFVLSKMSEYTHTHMPPHANTHLTTDGSTSLNGNSQLAAFVLRRLSPASYPPSLRHTSLSTITSLSPFVLSQEQKRTHRPE